MTTLHDMPQHLCDELLAFHGKAKAAIGRAAGFGGEIVFFDNGEHVFPRFTAAKYPRRKSGQSLRASAQAFLREMTLQAKAHYHPNVHWPFDLVMLLGVPVAYFRRWEGDLSAFIEDERLGNEGRLSIMIQLVAGLAHCQARGLVHQDLKPENVFVRDLRRDFVLPEGDIWLRPLVADFGSVNLAAEIDEFRGSRPYMAPEQWKATVLDERTNVFAAGIMLHELMTRGVHPIGTHGGDWHRRINPGFNRWQDNDRWRGWVIRGCPIADPLPEADLAKIVEACLAVEPAARPSLADLGNRLLSSLFERSKSAGAQCDLFLRTAEREAAQEEWAHLKSRLSRLSRAIDHAFPQNADPS
jgi:serine/threonine protein kinase